MFIYLNKRGQGTLEYGVIIAVIVGALIAMQVYLKRGVQGRLKQAADDIGGQFSPVTSTVAATTTTTSSTTETVSGGSFASDTMPTTASNSTQAQSRNVTEGAGAISTETW